MMKGKKTLLYSALVIALGALEAAEGLIPADTAGYALMVVGVGIAALRIVTTSPLWDQE